MKTENLTLQRLQQVHLTIEEIQHDGPGLIVKAEDSVCSTLEASAAKKGKGFNNMKENEETKKFAAR